MENQDTRKLVSAGAVLLFNFIGVFLVFYIMHKKNGFSAFMSSMIMLGVQIVAVFFFVIPFIGWLFGLILIAGAHIYYVMAAIKGNDTLLAKIKK